jgi:TRAP-type mannitol/chloroaromatic compound transport system substrate-binding protein
LTQRNFYPSVLSLLAGFSPSGIVSRLSFHKHHIQKEEKFMSKSNPVKGKNSKQAKAEKGLSRRKFLASAALAAGGAAATVGFPSVVKAQGPISMRWQSTWPTKDIFHEYALDFAKKVNDMTGGDLKIEVLPAGAVVPAFNLLDAVSKGTLDGGHGVLVYHYGKAQRPGLVGIQPCLRYGRQHVALLAQVRRRQGVVAGQIYASIGANVVSFPYGPMATQPLAGSRSLSPRLKIFKGLKFRTVGISIDLFHGTGRCG